MMGRWNFDLPDNSNPRDISVNFVLILLDFTSRYSTSNGHSSRNTHRRIYLKVPIESTFHTDSNSSL